MVSLGVNRYDPILFFAVQDFGQEHRQYQYGQDGINYWAYSGGD
jgi:hypothetical protein